MVWSGALLSLTSAWTLVRASWALASSRSKNMSSLPSSRWRENIVRGDDALARNEAHEDFRAEMSEGAFSRRVAAGGMRPSRAAGNWNHVLPLRIARAPMAIQLTAPRGKSHS